MKKIFELLIFLLLLSLAMLAMSCGGTRNATKNETKAENINIENTYSMGEKIVLNDIFIYTPLDISKPMIVNGKSYQNAVIKSNKSVLKEKYFNITKKYNIVKTVIINKTTDKTNYIYLWLGMFLIVVLGIIAYLKIPSFKMGI